MLHSISNVATALFLLNELDNHRPQLSTLLVGGQENEFTGGPFVLTWPQIVIFNVKYLISGTEVRVTDSMESFPIKVIGSFA